MRSAGSRSADRPLGVLLAGGDGRRLGGDKSRVELGGEPLAHHALSALHAALDEVVVACRLDTDLPALPGVREAWVEPAGPRGPLGGIVSALREAQGRPIVACAVSLPLMTADVLRALAAPRHGGAVVTVPLVGGALQPLVARWEPSALAPLSGLPLDTPLETVMRALVVDPIAMDEHEECFLRVEAPEDLLLAGAVLDARRRRSRSSV